MGKGREKGQLNKGIMERAKKHALMFIKRDETVRSLADKTGYCKSTIHRDLNIVLPLCGNPELTEKVKEKLEHNYSVKHIRGGMASKKKREKEGK